jgi:triacylglycerol lipase
VKGPKGTPAVSVQIYQPPQLQGTVGGIFHIHGGGYVSGRAADDEPAHRRLTAALGCVLTSVDYRLAPETTFPGSIEDCYAALAWLFESATELHVDPRRIGVMGESAGGGLAAALALLARDRGEFKLAFQHLIYPMLDDRTCVAAEPHPFAGEYIWTLAHNQIGWSALLGAPPGSKGVSPYAAAARAQNLAGLPPTFMATAALDLFVEENLEYARRLLRSGVAVELHLYAGSFHGFDLDPSARVAQAARRDSLAALARALGHQSDGSRS